MRLSCCFFFNDTATTEIYTLSLHDALPIFTIMIQKEVGDRIAAKENTKEYGALSLLVQYYCDIKVVRKVAPTSFIPKPKVESIVIKLDRLEKPRVEVKDKDLFFRVIRASFNMRRKTLWNGVKSLGIDKEILEKAFEKAGIEPKKIGRAHV